MKLLEPRHTAAGLAGKPGSRPATFIIHDSSDARRVLFRFAPKQAVPVHRSTSTVMLSVLAGRGRVTGADGDCDVAEGDVVVYEPNETHGMMAGEDPLVLLATITPRPGERAAADHNGRQGAAITNAAAD
jgi:quercetin dioxygenase-like cupin family protein